VALGNNPIGGRVVRGVKEDLVCAVDGDSGWWLHGVFICGGLDVRCDVDGLGWDGVCALGRGHEGDFEACGVAGDGIPGYGLGD